MAGDILVVNISLVSSKCLFELKLSSEGVIDDKKKPRLLHSVDVSELFAHELIRGLEEFTLQWKL